jgi:predicted Zn-dependent protease
VIDLRSLARALAKRAPADWVVLQRDQELAVVDDQGLQRAERRTRWQLTVHADTSAGRGTAHVAIDALDGDPDKLVDDAIAFALASTGPAWATIPSAAPARVDVADPAIITADPTALAEGVLRATKRPAGATVTARVAVLREHVNVAGRSGFHTEWLATRLDADAVIAVGAHSLAVQRAARRVDSLGLDGALADAIEDLQKLASAGAPAAGPCALVLGPDAMLHGGLGVWATFETQADAVVARQNLTRFYEQAPIVPGADQIADALTIGSNGALPFGVRSTPMGEDGSPVRKFTLVEKGVAAELGLSPREAALRHREPNGGVRNLVVSLGNWSEQLEVTRGRLVEVRRLRALEIDPYTGEANIEIALGLDHGPNRSAPTPFAGGTLRIDLIAALAFAHRSTKRIRRDGYDGPGAVLIDHAELIA